MEPAQRSPSTRIVRPRQWNPPRSRSRRASTATPRRKRQAKTWPLRGLQWGRVTRVACGAALLVGVTLWLAINLVVDPTVFCGLALIGLTNGSLYALLTLGYSLSYGSIGLINLPHGYVFITAAVFSSRILTALHARHGEDAPSLIAKLLLALA